MTSEGIVYMVRAKGTDHYKIGYTSQDVAKRVSSLQTGCPHELEAVATWPGTLDDESKLHELLDEFRGIGEWFELTVPDLVEFSREMVAEDEEVEVETEDEEAIDDEAYAWLSRDDPAFQRTLSVLKAADITGFSFSSILKEIRDGNLNAIDDGMYWVSRMDLQQWWADAGGGQLFSDLPAKDLQSYLKVVSDRTIEALQEKAERGEYTGGQPPYGYQVADDGVNLEPCEEEQRVIAEAHKHREAGLSLRKIAARLAEQGFVNRSGKNFQPTSVTRILQALDESA